MRRCAFALVAALAFSACQNTREFSFLGQQGKTRIGQLFYASPKRAVVGDVVMNYLATGDYDLSFAKGGVTVLQLQARGSRVRASGLLARGGFSGDIYHLPGPLRPWGELKDIIPYFDSHETQAQQPGRWKATLSRQAGILTRVQVLFRRGDSMTFNFAQ
jgi:hypothetical protein